MTSTLPQSSQNIDSKHTISVSPNNAPSPPTSPCNKPTIHPIGNNSEVIDCITKIFPDAIKSYSDAPRHMKDVWFNEFRKSYKWNPEDETVIQNIFHKKATKRLSDMLHQVRKQLAKDEGHPKWMTAPKEKLGEKPSHAALFQATHERKKADEFVCKKAQQVLETITQIQQTQPELNWRLKCMVRGSW
nr:dual specificity protein kinase shkD-like [Ipomoea batatas]